ncbi:MAG: hypothetical protein ACRC4M_02875 [Mycoplasma sp.]
MKILVFGITGSIGNSLVDIIQPHTIVGVSYFNNQDLAQTIIKKHNIPHYFSSNKDCVSNVDSIDELIIKSKPDLIVNAVTGYSGLEYTIKALEHKINLALANKESLVMAGKFVNQLAKESNVKIFPIDSEHSALYELIHTNHKIKTLYITCSGGSCYLKNENELSNISYQEVIKHPNWAMGDKISHDSATLINKAFEIIEAYHLFNIKNIIALYHPQSIIHGMVEFEDNSIFANMSTPDMRLAIDLAINSFNKSSTPKIKPLSFTNLNLSLNDIDSNKWKPIKWAYDVIEDQNNCLGLIITIANEKAINAFKSGEIKFNEFYSYIERYIEEYKDIKVTNLNELNVLFEKIKSSDI